MIILKINIEPKDITKLHAELNQIKGFIKGVTQQNNTEYQKAFLHFEKVLESVNNTLN